MVPFVIAAVVALLLSAYLGRSRLPGLCSRMAGVGRTFALKPPGPLRCFFAEGSPDGGRNGLEGELLEARRFVLRTAELRREERAAHDEEILAIRASRTDMERRLERAEQDAARREDDFSHFAYAVSHDLQEPLRSITGFLGLLRRKVEDNADALRYASRASEAGDRMSQLIHDLLTYSRIVPEEDGFRTVDTEEPLAGALANLTAVIEESSAIVTRDPLPHVFGSPSLLTQLFQNLIGNALKYRSAAPPKVHVSAREAGGGWEFSVRDNGIGIDPRFQDRIFRIFQRLHTREEYPGTGAGLAIAKRIVEVHGGTIRVESAPGRGATFIFVLPRRGEETNADR
jgi:light-regulated signal transduction histidine kinase (bacteriophytochrome)